MKRKRMLQKVKTTAGPVYAVYVEKKSGCFELETYFDKKKDAIKYIVDKVDESLLQRIVNHFKKKEI